MTVHQEPHQGLIITFSVADSVPDFSFQENCHWPPDDAALSHAVRRESSPHGACTNLEGCIVMAVHLQQQILGLDMGSDLSTIMGDPDNACICASACQRLGNPVGWGGS